VHVDAPDDLLGRIARVRVTEAKPNSLAAALI
jgi:tRNA-2-methylthio-N6-dimethylallyladenosine synthase